MGEAPDSPTPRAQGEAAVPGTTPQPRAAWRAPRFEVIPLDCEISAYAPAGDEPLF